MLVLAFIGLILMNIHSRAYWFYSEIMAVLYAVLTLGLFWYLNRGQHKSVRSTLWHQLLHWSGLIGAIYIITIFVNTGIVGATQAGLITLLLIALTVFLCGVYSDPAFLLVGVVLAIFAGAAVMISTYLSIIMLPVVLLAAILIYFITRHQKKKELRL